MDDSNRYREIFLLDIILKLSASMVDSTPK